MFIYLCILMLSLLWLVRQIDWSLISEKKAKAWCILYIYIYIFMFVASKQKSGVHDGNMKWRVGCGLVPPFLWYLLLFIYSLHLMLEKIENEFKELMAIYLVGFQDKTTLAWLEAEASFLFLVKCEHYLIKHKPPSATTFDHGSFFPF